MSNGLGLQLFGGIALYFLGVGTLIELNKLTQWQEGSAILLGSICVAMILGGIYLITDCLQGESDDHDNKT